MVHISVERERLLQLRLGLCGAHLEGLAALEGLGELDDSLRDLLVRLAHRVPLPLELQTHSFELSRRLGLLCQAVSARASESGVGGIGASRRL